MPILLKSPNAMVEIIDELVDAFAPLALASMAPLTVFLFPGTAFPRESSTSQNAPGRHDESSGKCTSCKPTDTVHSFYIYYVHLEAGMALNLQRCS